MASVENNSSFSVLLSNVVFGFSYFVLFGFRFLFDLTGNFLYLEQTVIERDAWQKMSRYGMTRVEWRPRLWPRRPGRSLGRFACYGQLWLPTCLPRQQRKKKVTGSNPVEALIFFRLLPSNCLNWKIYCDDLSSLSFHLPVESPHCQVSTSFPGFSPPILSSAEKNPGNEVVSSPSY